MVCVGLQVESVSKESGIGMCAVTMIVIHLQDMIMLHFQTRFGSVSLEGALSGVPRNFWKAGSSVSSGTG